MGHIGNMTHPEVHRTVDEAIAKIVSQGRTAGTLVSAANVESYTRKGVRCIMTSFFPWIQAGAKDLMDRAAAGAKS
jgi:2-keto-3-deoxy-L-rhamnonate aldolase RhmA